MTSIAETPRRTAPLRWFRFALLTLLFTWLAQGTPGAWGVMWFAVPVTVAVSLLLAWRFGRAAFAMPVLLAAGSLGAALGVPDSPVSLWIAGWIPAASVTGVWMGSREEGGGPGLGERVWMLAPFVLLAASLSLTPAFRPALDRAWTRAQTTALAELRREGVPQKQVAEMESTMRKQDPDVRRALPYAMPVLLVLWMALLTAAGRGLAGLVAGRLGWPALSNAAFLRLRLPDAALAPVIAGLALALLADRSFLPGALALLVPSALGYSLQGLAVLVSLLLTRGIPATLAAILIMGLLALTTLAFLPSLALVGLTDAWLDLRKLESPGDREA